MPALPHESERPPSDPRAAALADDIDALVSRRYARLLGSEIRHLQSAARVLRRIAEAR